MRKMTNKPTVHYEIDGEKMTLRQIAERYNLSYDCVKKRHLKKWGLCDIIQPLGYHHKKNGKRRCNRKEFYCKRKDIWDKPILVASKAIAGQMFACFDCLLRECEECEGYETPTPSATWGLIEYLGLYKKLGMTLTEVIQALPHDFGLKSLTSMYDALLLHKVKWSDIR